MTVFGWGVDVEEKEDELVISFWCWVECIMDVLYAISPFFYFVFYDVLPVL